LLKSIELFMWAYIAAGAAIATAVCPFFVTRGSGIQHSFPCEPSPCILKLCNRGKWLPLPYSMLMFNNSAMSYQDVA
jgi:hypothetical protein